MLEGVSTPRWSANRHELARASGGVHALAETAGCRLNRYWKSREQPGTPPMTMTPVDPSPVRAEVVQAGDTEGTGRVPAALVRVPPGVVVAAAAGVFVLAFALAGIRRRRAQRPRLRRAGNPLDLTNVSAVLFDIDGTLLDSNAAHADTWAQALVEHHIKADSDAIRPLVGMGGDKLLPTVAGVSEGSRRGRALSARKKELFDSLVPTLRPTRGASELVAFLREAGKELIIATSADDKELRALLEQAGVADLIPRRTSKDDASKSKPDPDIVEAALARVRAQDGLVVMVGDTPYDVEAAGRAGVPTIALRSGGYWTDASLEGAAAVFEDPAALLAHWQGQPVRRSRT